MPKNRTAGTKNESSVTGVVLLPMNEMLMHPHG